MHIADDLFQRFAVLDEACIDASSMIYMQKAGFLDVICTALRLYTVPAMILETGFDAPGISLLQPPDATLPPDTQLLQCACERQLPVISEDKQLLFAAKRANLPYYNAVMMLNWLVFKRLIDTAEYHVRRAALGGCARYSRAVWEYGDAVYHAALERRRAVDQAEKFLTGGVAAVKTAEHR